MRIIHKVAMVLAMAAGTLGLGLISPAALKAEPALDEGTPSRFERAVQAALDLTGGVLAEPGQPCREVAPAGGVCVFPQSTPDNAERGIALFGAGDDFGGAILVLALDPAGQWVKWFVTQNITFRQLVLPGAMRVCESGAAVRATPDRGAPVDEELPAGTLVMAEEFRLDLDRSGWYRVSGPVSGWMQADGLSTAALSTCTERDAAVSG